MNVSASQLGSGLLGPGQVVDGRYRIESYLGGGGMASVYRGVHLVLEQPVAIKILSPAIRDLPGAAARFIREARAATQLKSVNVVRVSDVGTLPDGAPYMVMELLEGQDLDEHLATGWRPSVEEAVRYVLQTCTALAEVHGLGIVHRDVKPANLFLTTGSDGRPLVKLIDFGISRVRAPVLGPSAVVLTNPDVVMGSPRYMSPEAMESATTPMLVRTSGRSARFSTSCSPATRHTTATRWSTSTPPLSTVRPLLHRP
jgi:eukaryotic-like serine/threonine-protein kinase